MIGLHRCLAGGHSGVLSHGRSCRRGLVAWRAGWG